MCDQTPEIKVKFHSIQWIGIWSLFKYKGMLLPELFLFIDILRPMKTGVPLLSCLHTCQLVCVDYFYLPTFYDTTVNTLEAILQRAFKRKEISTKQVNYNPVCYCRYVLFS